jgi:hypothetical protein
VTNASSLDLEIAIISSLEIAVEVSIVSVIVSPLISISPIDWDKASIVLIFPMSADV